VSTTNPTWCVPRSGLYKNSWKSINPSSWSTMWIGRTTDRVSIHMHCGAPILFLGTTTIVFKKCMSLFPRVLRARCEVTTYFSQVARIISVELYLHSPPASDSKDHNVATEGCTSSFYNNFVILQNAVFCGIVAGSSLINCIELN